MKQYFDCAYLFVSVDQKIVGAQSKDHQGSNNLPTSFRSEGILRIVEANSWKRSLRSSLRRSRITGGSHLIAVCRHRICSSNSSNAVTTVSCCKKRSNSIWWPSIEKNFRSKYTTAHNFPCHFESRCVKFASRFQTADYYCWLDFRARAIVKPVFQVSVAIQALAQTHTSPTPSGQTNGLTSLFFANFFSVLSDLYFSAY